MKKKKINLQMQKSILLELLLELDKFCKENNIPYYLIGGTLLGAIRHNGFIPWDDDIDICMFRKDYEKFIKIYKSNNSKYKLFALETKKDYYYPFAKLVNDETILIESGNEKNPIGIYVDIFPIDNCPGKTLEEAYKNIDRMNVYRWLRNFKIINFSMKRNILKNLILLFGKILVIPITKRKISELISYNAKKNIDINCQFVGELVNTTYGYGEVYDRIHFGEGIEVVFEEKLFTAPKDYDYILKSMYGDYMKLPPEEKRISNHDVKCWYK